MGLLCLSVCLSILSVCERTGNGLDKGPPAHQSISHRESTPNGQIWKRKRKGEYRKEIAESRLRRVDCERRLWEGDCGKEIVERRLWKGDSGNEIVERRMLKADCGKEIAERRLWEGDCGKEIREICWKETKGRI